MDSELLLATRRRFEAAQRVLLTSHVRPDGDAVSSVLALGLALHQMGKEVQMVLSDGVSSDARHLQGVELITKKAVGPVDLVITLDAAAQDRSDALTGFPKVDINIDHHITNTRFATINLIDPAAVSTTALLAEHFLVLGLPFTPAVVDALLNGMITDTMGFRTSNMTPKAMRIAADLMDLGAELPTLYERALLRRSFVAMKYWGAGLSSLQHEDGLVWATLSLADRMAVGYPGNDDAELVNNISMIEGAAITLLFIEQTDNQVKISWRSQGGHDVARLAAQFGGGGHVAAAGAVLSGSLAEVQVRVLQATRAALQAVPAKVSY